MTSSQYSPQLSKSRFMAGLQCLKRLYLECYERELADPIDERQQAIFDTGTGVGELAREMYPNGRLVEEQYFELGAEWCYFNGRRVSRSVMNYLSKSI